MKTGHSHTCLLPLTSPSPSLALPSAPFSLSIHGQLHRGRLNAFNINVSIWVLYSRSVGPFDHGDESDGQLDRNVNSDTITFPVHDRVSMQL